MEICKDKQIHNFCHPNAILTLKEYLEDYASPETKEVGEKLISKEQKTLECPECVKLKVAEDLEKIEQGGRDYNF